MNCSQCGSEVTKKDQFCRTCGAPVLKARAERRGRTRWKDILPWTIFGVLASTVVFLVYLVGASMQSASRIRQLDPAASSSENDALSPAQVEAKATYGEPQAFTLLFYTEEEAAGGLVSYRHEIWTYFSNGVELTFLNGELLGETRLPFSESVLTPMPYRPEQFRAFMTLDEISAVIGPQEVLEIPVEPEIAADGRVFYTSQLSFALAEGELVYVETIPVEAAAE
ncbi:MAG: zinc ribbon domain-containing protein [Anaerolineales bacterium]|nr:zinc ribbon domain-containing protein [Anaerolineales bacterium]